MKATNVSVLIVSYECRQALADCLCSLETQRTAIAEVIVVDNGSRDGTVQALRAWSGALPLQLVANAGNRGFAAAANQALGRARGAFLLLLNPDTRLMPGSLDRLSQTLRDHPQAAAVGALLLDAQGQEQRGARRGEPTPGAVLHHLLGRLGHRGGDDGYDLSRRPLPDEDTAVAALSGACMMIRRAALEQVGLLDEGYRMHCEDLDWCRRSRDAGWQLRFEPRARAVHIGGVSSARRPLWVEWHKARGMARYFRKHVLSPGAVLLLPALLVIAAAFFLVRLVGGLRAAGRRGA